MNPLRIRETLPRLFVPADRLRSTVAHYEALTGGRCSLHFPFPERELRLASVSSPTASFLIVAGSDASLAKARTTSLTLVVDDIRAVADALLPQGAVELQPVTAVPTGFQARYRRADGLVVEYVEHTEAAEAYRGDGR